MAEDLLEQLAYTQPPPPPPPEMVKEVHHRLNINLLIGQLAEFLLRSLPLAFVYFALAVAGLISFTLSGKYPSSLKQEDPQNDS